MDGVHDLGGMHGFGTVLAPGDQRTHAEEWEVRAQVVALLAQVVSRRRLEALPPVEYLGSSYYVRWLLAAERGAISRGLVDPVDIDRWRAAITADPDTAVPATTSPAPAIEEERRFLSTAPALDPASGARFTTGDPVRVRRSRPVEHHRCPRYVRGADGTVEAVVGCDVVPGGSRSDGEREPVYTVRFDSTALWGPTDEPAFEVMIDLWERYLEPA